MSSRIFATFKLRILGSFRIFENIQNLWCICKDVLVTSFCAILMQAGSAYP